MQKYKVLVFSGRATFSAAAIETLEAFGPSARSLVKLITRWQGRAGGGPDRYTRNRLTKAIVCSVLERNAACVLEAYTLASDERQTQPSWGLVARVAPSLRTFPTLWDNPRTAPRSHYWLTGLTLFLIDKFNFPLFLIIHYFLTKFNFFNII